MGCWQRRLHPWARQVLQSGGMTKHVAFMREFAFLCNAPNMQALPAPCVGACLAVLFRSRAMERHRRDVRLVRLQWPKNVGQVVSGGAMWRDGRRSQSRHLAFVGKAVWKTRIAEQEVGVIDDMLVPGQNLTARYEPTHVPTTSDAVAAQVWAVLSRWMVYASSNSRSCEVYASDPDIGVGSFSKEFNFVRV